jgi:hypothetical protein
MNTVSSGEISKLAARKVVFPVLFALLALAIQMMVPVSYLYAQGGTVSLNVHVVSPLVYCISLSINGGSSQNHPHIHQHPNLITFANVMSPGESDVRIQAYRDHLCAQGTKLGNQISITIPNLSTLSGCMIELDQTALAPNVNSLNCNTVGLTVNTISSSLSVSCISLSIKGDRLLKYSTNLPHQDFGEVANPGDTGTLAMYKDQACSKRIGKISITIPTSTLTGSTCTFGLNSTALKKHRVMKWSCQQAVS